MNIDYARKIVKDNLLIQQKFLYKGSRNQNEEFIGVITKMFPAIFIIELNDSSIKSFSYNDLLIGNLRILTKNKDIDFSKIIL